VHTSPLRYLASGAAVGAAAAALVVGLSGPTSSEQGSAVAAPTADVVGTAGKPVKQLLRNVVTPLRQKARQRPPVVEAAHPNDPLWGDSWSLSKVGAPTAWRLTSGAAETVVAVLDTGVDRTHADLHGAFVDGWDAVNEDADPSDDHGHGTLVAGVIAARSNNGIGGVGACPRCSLMPVKVIGANGAGSAADIAEGITWAADHGARVINMSFALSGPDDGVAQAIAYAQGRGTLVVAAAGNAGTGETTYPAAYPGVVSVAATDPADARYAWSNYGSWVRVAAPGCSVGTAAGGAYADFCGTSSATALVSGVAGLLGSAVSTRSAADLSEALAGTALRVGDFVSGGRIDVGAAINSFGPERPRSAAPSDGSPAASKTTYSE